MLTYTDRQMIHTLSNNNCSVREIAEALGIPKSTVHRVLQQNIEPSCIPEIVGDGCYTTSTGNGEMVPSDLIDYDEELSNNRDGQLTRLESGYPDIYYNEQSKRWEIWLGGKRIWRATSLIKACEVRLAKGSLSKGEQALLQAVLDSPVDVQDALNYPPI